MHKNLIHLKSDLNSLKKSYILCLILVSLFGIYKNIINLMNVNVSFILVVSRCLFIALGFGFGVLYDYFKIKKFNINFNSLIGLIFGMIVPFNTNFIIYFISLLFIFLLDLIDKDNKINRICVIKLICIVLVGLFQEYTYFNPLESMNEYAYSLVDKFIGNQVGGLFSTSVLLILTSLIVLSLNGLYKTKIAIISLGSYLFVALFLLLTKNYSLIFNIMLNSSNIFAFVFIAPFSIYSPYKPKAIILYSMIVGILSAIISYLFLFHEGAIIAILLANFSMILYNKFQKTTNNS